MAASFGWLGKYMDLSQHQQSPSRFHLWVGMTTMASVLTRNVWLDRRSDGITWYQVFPGQMMVILVAPPGKGKKGTAMRLGRRLMNKVDVHVIKGKGSTEGLLRKIAAAPVRPGQTKIVSKPPAIATIVAPELSVLLSKQQYADSLIDVLMDLYDGEDPFEHTTVNNPIILHNPCVTFLAGATPISIGDSIPEKCHSSGFTGRFLHVYHNGMEKATNPLTDLRDEDITPAELQARDQLEKDLVLGLREMQNLSGGFEYTKAGRQWYSDWVKAWEATSAGQQEGYAQRRPDHLCRVAMVSVVSRQIFTPPVKLVLDQPDFEAALAALEKIEEGFDAAFACIGESALAKAYERIQNVVHQAGGRMLWKELVVKTYRYFKDATEIRSMMRTLVEAGLLYYDVDSAQREWVSLTPIKP